MKNSKLKLILLMVPLMLLLSGCGGQNSVEYNGLWNTVVIWFAQFIVWLGTVFGSSLGMGVILATLVLRGIMVPLYAKSNKSQEQMKEIQPKINALNKKYAGKKDQDSQRKKAMEQQALYKEAGINPLAGCLPLLLQLPILFAFYDAIQYLVPADATIKALEAQGQTVVFGLQELGATSLNATLFGFDLNNPVIVFAVLSAATTFLATKVSMIGQDTDAPGSGMMKGMLYVMPAMIFVFGLTLPGALSIYWLIGNLVTIAQTLYFKKHHLQNARQQKKFK